MALHPCGECGQQISSSASACPQCGAAQRRTGRIPAGMVIGAGLLAILILWLSKSGSSQGADMSSQEAGFQSVSQCWSRYKGNIPPERQFEEGKKCSGIQHLYESRYGPYTGP